MALTRLKAGASVGCSPGMFQVDWQVHGAATQDVVVRVALASSVDAAAPGVSTSSGRAEISGLPHAVALVCGPATGRTFADGVSISCQLTLRIDDGNSAQFAIPRTDLSGTPRTTLAALIPQTGYVTISVPADLVVWREASTPVTPVASAPGPAAVDVAAARPGEPASMRPPAHNGSVPDSLPQLAAYAARRRSGVGRLATERRSALHIAVDLSASFLAVARSGAGQALLEVVVGANDVAGSETDVRVWAIGGVARELRPALSHGNVAGYWASALGDTAHTGGTLMSPVIESARSSDSAATVVFLTDGVPPDLAEAAQLLSGQQRAGTRTRWHVLAFARSAGDPQVRTEPWRDELASLAPLQAQGLLTYSAVTPTGAADLHRRLVGEPATLDDVVAGLPFWAGGR